MSERVVLAQLVLPPSKERCETAHCSQKAIVDLFPGSGAVGREWERWRRQLRLEVSA